MIQITKFERDYLVNSCGFKMGEDIFHTYSHNKHYYAKETKQLKKALDELNKQTIIYTKRKNGNGNG